MCGRYNLRATPKELAEAFALFREPEPYPTRFNTAPTQKVPVVRATEAGRDLSLMRSGLIPSWAKDAKIGNSLINARAETIAEKPSFRTAFKRRRCLIPASGFHESKKREGQT